jgi:thioredoxin:protein disulfide reductase
MRNRSQKPEARNQKLEAGSRKPEARSQKPETRRWKSADRKLRSVWLFLLGIVLAAAAFGQMDAEPVVAFGGSFTVQGGGPGGAATVLLPFDIQRGWHINADKVTDEFMVPSALEVETAAGIKVQRIAYPPAETVKLKISEKPLAAWKGRIAIGVVLSGLPASGAVDLKGKLTYQACNDAICQPPQDVEFSIRAALQSVPVSESAVDANPRTETSPPKNLIAGWVEKRGLILALFLIFLSGLALNLTPCVYPMIPITLGFFAKQAKGSKKNALLLSLSYFLGLTLTYSAVGTAAALTGSLFGTLMQKPAVLILVAGIIVLLALSLFGLFTIQLPAALAGKVSGRAGFLGGALMGAMVGLVAAPCIGPVVLALLTFITASGSPFLGFITFFALSCGLGVPYLALGIFSTHLAKLPKSGGWMMVLEQFFGFLLLGVAIFMLKSILPGESASILGAGLALFAFLWFLLRMRKGSAALNALFAVAALAAAAAVGLPLLTGGAGPVAHDPLFKPYERGAVDQAFRDGKPVMVDFAADWCIPCKEMEKTTFKDAKVRKLLENFAVFRADLTRGNDDAVRNLSEEFGIRGVPTMVFLIKGEELKDLRQVGYVSTDEFIPLLEKALKR